MKMVSGSGFSDFVLGVSRFSDWGCIVCIRHAHIQTNMPTYMHACMHACMHAYVRTDTEREREMQTSTHPCMHRHRCTLVYVYVLQ